jgi:alanine racemase
MTPSRPTGRPTVAEIDLKALAFNYRQIKKKIPKEARVMGVVKADAYGHGSVPVALELERLGAEYLGVAMCEEGVELRKGGVKAPILILGGIYSEEQADDVLRYRLTPVVFEKKALHLLSKKAKRADKKVKVHLKIDTGMGRLGVSLGSWSNFLSELKRFENIEAEGILSHFSMANEDGGTFSSEQWEKFQTAVKVAEGQGIHCKYFHIANSANLAAYPFSSGNLVRPGIMLYGSYPSPSLRDLIKLQPVMTLKTKIHFLKSVVPGTKISYGGTFVTQRETRIATLPIGYADGYNRQLSNRGEVLIRGKKAPVIGRVTMDYIMVDVTDIPHVSTGDEVVLLGKQGKERITAEEIAEKIHTISYEVFCSVGKRVPRVYKPNR